MPKKQDKEKNIEDANRNQLPDIPELYANAAIANISPYEFELTLGLGSSTYEGVKPVVNIRLSPQFAKEFSRILAENVKLYEETFGAITVPET